MYQVSYYIDIQEAHNKLDTIYNELFTTIDKKRLTFREISEEVFKRKNDLTGLIVRGVLNYEISEIEKIIRRECIKCKKVLTRHRQKTSILQSINGIILFTRNYFYCRKCRIGFCPSDKELQIIPRKLQFDVLWRILELAIKLPFEEAVKELNKHYGIKINKKTLHELIQSVSEGISIMDSVKTASEIRKELETLRNGSRRRIVVVIGIDGSHVPIRADHEDRKGKRGKGHWREAKGIRIYAIANKRIHHILSWHQIQNADELKKDLDIILEADYIPLDVARICVCADGADWIWNRVRKSCPGAKLVLDYYHCSEHINQFAEIYFENDFEKVKWIQKAKDDLFSGNVIKLVNRLRKMVSVNKDVTQQVILLAKYLEDRAEMTFYNSFKKGGYPIGSGGIESSNKYVCHRRMKLSGAWWKEKMANSMLVLRSAYVNGMLENVFHIYVEKQMRKHALY